MKKYLFLAIVAAMLVTLPAQAGIKFGVKAGVNLSDVSLDKSTLDPKNYTGFQVGPMMEFTVPVLGIGMDAAILYSQNGFKLNSESLKSSNLLVPVNFKYKLGLASLVGIYATAGPYVGFRLCDDRGSAVDIIKSKSFAAGLNFGLGVELLSHLQVGANYQLGLTNDWSNDGLIGSAENIVNAKTRVWSITAAYFF